MNKKSITIGVIFVFLIMALCGCFSDTEYSTNFPSDEDLQILSHNLTTTPYGSSVMVVGEVKNIGKSQIHGAQIKAKFYDENDVLIDTSFDYISDLNPGEKAYFEIMCLEYNYVVDHYTIAIGSVY